VTSTVFTRVFWGGHHFPVEGRTPQPPVNFYPAKQWRHRTIGGPWT